MVAVIPTRGGISLCALHPPMIGQISRSCATLRRIIIFASV